MDIPSSTTLKKNIKTATIISICLDMRTQSSINTKAFKLNIQKVNPMFERETQKKEGKALLRY